MPAGSSPYVFLVPKLGYLPTSIAFGGVACLAGRLQARRHSDRCGGGPVDGCCFQILIGAQIPGGELYNYLPSQVRPFMLTYL